MLLDWDDTKPNFSCNKSIHELFEDQSERTPNAVALICGEEYITYRELNNQANQLAKYLRQIGVSREVLVAICIERSIAMIVGILGVLKAGGCYLPLDPTYPQSRLEDMLVDSQPKVILSQSKWAKNLSIPGLATQLVAIDLAWEIIANQSVINLPRYSSSANLAYVIYTSGSTGKPKGVMIEHRSLVNFCEAIIKAYSLSEIDRVLQFAALSFDTSVEEIFPSLVCGATLVLRTEIFLSSISSFLKECAKYSLTLLNLPTAFWHELTLQIEYQNLSLPESLRLIVIGGESALPERIRTWFKYVRQNIQLVNSYGCTEATAVSTITFLEMADNQNSLAPIGRPITNVQAYILDKHFCSVPVGIVGELYIGGEGLARGYLNRPELTEEKFIKNPFNVHDGARIYHTGDLARYNDNGSIEVIGRIDNQVKIHGFRIELGEIETAIRKHPYTDDVVAVVREDISGDKRLVAYITTQNSQFLNINELRSYIEDKLPKYMVPAYFVLLNKLPLTPSGKIDRQSLPLPDIYNSGLSQSIVSARNELEAQLTYVWEKALKIKPIGVTNNFFELGGNSFLAFQLSLSIKKHLNINIIVHTVFQYPTIEKMAVAIQKDIVSEIPLSILVPLQIGIQSKTPLFFIHPAAGEAFIYMNIVRYLEPEQPVYGIRSTDPTLTSIEAMANRYIELIQEVQPIGPYTILGYSMGGYVAFEIAKQLVNKGETISHLVLIDTKPLFENQKIELSEIQEKLSDTEETLKDVLIGFANPDLTSQQIKDLSQMDFEKQLAYILQQMKTSNRATPNAEISWLRELISNVYRNQDAIRYYRPGKYSGKVTLITAAEGVNDRDENLDWNKFTQSDVVLYNIPGNHYTIIKEPNVKFLADKIHLCIRGRL